MEQKMTTLKEALEFTKITLVELFKTIMGYGE